MASLMQQEDRSDCQFMYQGKWSLFPLGNLESSEAEANADYLLLRLRQGLLNPPRE